MFPPEVTKSVAFYHLPTTGGSGQPYPGTASLTADCALLPMDRKDAALEAVDLVDPWELYCPTDADIRLQDKAIISGDSSNWYVKHIFNASFGGLAHKRVTISKNS